MCQDLPTRTSMVALSFLTSETTWRGELLLKHFNRLEPGE